MRFRRPIYADETISLEWLVVKVTPNEKLRGGIAEVVVSPSAIFAAPQLETAYEN